MKNLVVQHKFGDILGVTNDGMVPSPGMFYTGRIFHRRNDCEKSILYILKERPHLTFAQISSRLGHSHNVRFSLKVLIRAGRVRKRGKNRSTWYERIENSFF